MCHLLFYKWSQKYKTLTPKRFKFRINCVRRAYNNWNAWKRKRSIHTCTLYFINLHCNLFRFVHLQTESPFQCADLRNKNDSNGKTKVTTEHNKWLKLFCWHVTLFFLSSFIRLNGQRIDHQICLFFQIWYFWAVNYHSVKKKIQTFYL